MAYYDRDYYREDYQGGAQRRVIGGMPGMQSFTMWLIIINAFIFLVDAFSTPENSSVGYLYRLGMFSYTEGIENLQLWRLFTYQFLHADFFHILFNMVMLFFFGPMAEKYWGSVRFLAFYLISGLGGALLYLVALFTLGEMIYLVEATPIVGASGCLFGVLICAAMVAPDMKIQLLIPPIPMQLRTLAIGLLIFAVIKVLYTIATGEHANAGGEVGHLGGALAGFALMKLPFILDWTDLSKVKQKMAVAAAQRDQAATQAELEEEDRILSKVKAEGIHSLTDKERKFLEKLTEKRRDL